MLFSKFFLRLYKKANDEISEKLNALIAHITSHRNSEGTDDQYIAAQDFNAPEAVAENDEVKATPGAVKRYLNAYINYQKEHGLDPYKSPRKVYFDKNLRPLMAEVDNGWFGDKEFYPALGEGDNDTLVERAKQLAFISLRTRSI